MNVQSARDGGYTVGALTMPVRPDSSPPRHRCRCHAAVSPRRTPIATDAVLRFARPVSRRRSRAAISNPLFLDCSACVVRPDPDRSSLAAVGALPAHPRRTVERDDLLIPRVISIGNECNTGAVTSWSPTEWIPPLPHPDPPITHSRRLVPLESSGSYFSPDAVAAEALAVRSADRGGLENREAVDSQPSSVEKRRVRPDSETRLTYEHSHIYDPPEASFRARSKRSRLLFVLIIDRLAASPRIGRSRFDQSVWHTILIQDTELSHDIVK